ncbi:hypothetical protein N9L47_03090 [Rhodobacteraceae bacterium]|nr:hypothetical protein [Paracoccaceae bacterium]
MGRLLIGLIMFVVILGVGVFVIATPGTSEAYAEAEKRIAAARDEDARVLRLDDLANLGRLPPELGEMTELIQINLRGTAIHDLTPLSGLKNLRILSLRDTLVEDLTPLSDLPKLDTLDISHTWVHDLSPLTTIPALRRIDIGGTWIASLEPALAMARLDWINMHQGYASDGSQQYYDALATKGVTVNNGRAFQDDFRPSVWFLTKLRISRSIKRVRLGLKALD